MKNLSKIPRKITAKFCWQKSGPNNEPDQIENQRPVVKNVEYKTAGVDVKSNGTDFIETQQVKLQKEVKMRIATAEEAKAQKENKQYLAENGIIDTEQIQVKPNNGDSELNKVPYEVAADGLGNPSLEEITAGNFNLNRDLDLAVAGFEKDAARFGYKNWAA